ncbi:unnamed protein product [Caenorhabditis sp. 36 PRJEB53466]|nr:unnamed protein product [Caenorhabditis sp. 36 PRJEB53466]
MQNETLSYARLKNVVGRSGVTVNGIALHHASDTLLQVAGSSIIVSSTATTDRFEGHLISATKQQFTCVAVTACGKYAATGETGHQPAVRLWQLRDDQGNFVGRLVRTMQAHTVSVTIVRFTPDDSTLISVGCQHDAQIITWDWRNGHDLGVGKLMSPVNAMTISFDSSMCVTVGSKSVKYWFLPMASDGVSKRTGLTSRSAILADKRNVNFVDVAFCDTTNRMVAVTSNGEILEFNGNKKYVKCYSWKESGDFKAVCLARIPEGLLVGCSDGLVRLFCLIGDDLDFLADLAPPTHLFLDPSNVYEPEQLQNHPEDAIFPEPRCLVASSSSSSFVVGYSDRSLIEFARENKTWSFRRASLGHTGSVNCIESFPSSSPCLPAGTVITGGADGTVRFWNFGGETDDKKDIANILCPSLLKVIYLDETPELLIDKRNLESIGPSNEEQSSATSGVLCTRVTHDGRMMIAGTATGMLYLIDLSFSDTPIIDVINAHDTEVASIDFSDHAHTTSRDQPMFLASGGRDRFVHVFRRIPYSSKFVHCAVLDGHQASIKSIKFAAVNGQLHLYTAATDRSLIIWKLDSFSEQHCQFTRAQQISVPSSIGDMEFVKYVDSLVVAGHDRMLRQFDINGKPIREVKGTDDDVAHTGKIQKVAVDASGSYAISVCSDKFVYVTDLRTGACLAVLCGFGAPPTDATFSDDFKTVLVTTANGAIFIWQLAKNVTERMISAQVRLMEEVTMRTATPDSLLGSGSETISGDSSSFARPLGAPEFSGSSASLYSDDDSTRFSSSVRSSRTKRSHPNGGHPIGSSSYARVGDSSFSPAVQSAPAVERRTHTNLFSHDQYETDISETQSDFVSSRRKNRLFSDDDEQDSSHGSGQYLAAPLTEARRSASPSLYVPNNDQLRGYQSSKSMMNLRDVTGGGGVRVQTAKELMLSHIASQRNSQSGSSSNLTPNTSGRMKWGDMTPLSSSTNNNDWHPSSTTIDIHHVSPVMATSIQPYAYRNEHHASPYNLPDSTHPPPLAPRTTSRVVLSTAPSHQALQQIQANSSPFRRKSMDRNSLSKKFLENGGAQPKTVWSPSSLANAGAPRRSNSNLFAAVNSETATPMTNLSRRPDDLNLNLNVNSALRSRSQSPNKLALSQMIGSRGDTPSSPSSTGGSIVGAARGIQQRRRDSDVSYVRSATRGRDEMRKSTDALNKLMAVRSKLHQSSENLRKSTENLALLKNLEEAAASQGTPKTRTRSSSNLRNAEALGNMESFGTFDADSRMKSGSTSSLAHSRMMARSIGNLNDSLAMEGSMSNNYDSPSKRLANTIQMMKKASNPDLTAPEQFEDTGSPFAMRMHRGAVQKKMDRYRAKNKSGLAGGRNQTSEESDSNNSDMMPLSINKRALAAGNRSTTASECSPVSSRGSSSLASGPIGSGLPSSRRMYDQQRSGLSATSTPRRTGNNYLVTKLSEQMNKSMEGPDLGSDESPRSSVNSQEWQNLMENSQDGTRNPLICHVQDCMEQLRIHVDKSLQAKKLVEDDTTLAMEQKKIVMCEIDRSIERMIEKLAPPSLSKPSNGNDYTPKGANIYGILKENLSSRQ